MLSLLLSYLSKGVCQKNEISFGLQGVQYFSFYNAVISPVEFTHITYKHQIKNNLYAYANINFRTNLYYPQSKSYKSTYENDSYGLNAGDIYFRYNYNFYDVGVGLVVHEKNKHKISCSAGPSFTQGENRIFDKAEYIIFQGRRILNSIASHSENAAYFGFVLGSNYTYQYTKNWSAGFSLAYRNHNNGFPSLINYGIFLNCVL